MSVTLLCLKSEGGNRASAYPKDPLIARTTECGDGPNGNASFTDVPPHVGIRLAPACF